MKQIEIHLGCFYKYNGNICYVNSIHDDLIKIIYVNGGNSDQCAFTSAEYLNPLELDAEYLSNFNCGEVAILSIYKDNKNEPTLIPFQHVSKNSYIDYLCYIKFVHELQLHYLLSCGGSLTESLLSFYKNKLKQKNYVNK